MNEETDVELERFIMGAPTPSPVQTIEKAALQPGWKTSEFWMTVATATAPYVMHAIPPVWQAALSTAAGAVYAIARGLAKLGIGR